MKYSKGRLNNFNADGYLESTTAMESTTAKQYSPPRPVAITPSRTPFLGVP